MDSGGRATLLPLLRSGGIHRITNATPQDSVTGVAGLFGEITKQTEGQRTDNFASREAKGHKHPWRVRRSTRYLQAGDGEVGDEPDDLGVVLHLHQFSQLVIAFQPGQQSAEFVVVIWV